MTDRNKNTQKAGAVAYRSLKHLVTTYGLRPYEPLQTQSLATRFGVSATPVREALLRLQGEGLIAYNPSRGFHVKPIDAEEMAQLLHLRRLLLTEALQSNVVDVQVEPRATASAPLAARPSDGWQSIGGMLTPDARSNDIANGEPMWPEGGKDSGVSLLRIEAVDQEIAGLRGNGALVQFIAGISDRLRVLLVVDLATDAGRRTLFDEHHRMAAYLETRNPFDAIAALNAQTCRRVDDLGRLAQTAALLSRGVHCANSIGFTGHDLMEQDAQSSPNRTASYNAYL